MVTSAVLAEWAKEGPRGAMLVSCAKCKSPVFVSSAVVAMGEAEVGCSSCGTRLKVSSSGHSTMVGVPAPVLDLNALPSYEGGAAPAAQPSSEGAPAMPVDATDATVETPALPSPVPAAAPPAAAPARPPEVPPSRRGPRSSAGQLPSFLSAVPLSAVLTEGLSGIPAGSGAAGQLARASDGEVAGGFGSAAPSALPWGSTASTPWPPAASAPAAGGEGGVTAEVPSAAAARAQSGSDAASASPSEASASAAGRRPGAAPIVLAAPRADARAETRSSDAGVAESSRRAAAPSTTTVEPRQPAAAPSATAAEPRQPAAAQSASAAESPRPAATPSATTAEPPRPDALRAAAAPGPRVIEAARRAAASPPPRAVSDAVAAPARGSLASLGEPSTLFPPARAGAQRIPVTRRPHAAATSAPAWRPLAFAGLGVIGALALVAALWAASSGGDRAASKASPAPASAAGHYRQANALIAEHKAAEAVDELRKSLEVDPAYGLAYRSLGVAYMMLGRERSAVDAYDRFAALEPAHADADQARRIVEAYRRRTSPGP